MKKLHSKPFLLVLGLVAALIISCQSFSYGQGKVAIYGTIETVDGTTYTGPLRWGKEEAFWSDMFNSSKPRNTNVKYLSKSDYEKLKGDKKGWSNKYSLNFIWDDEYHATTHSFACRFGDIDYIEVEGSEDLTLFMKNGEEIELEGGSNDVGANILVKDSELGEISIPWKRIEKIDFKDTPARLTSNYGRPLVGKVITERGEYTGRIQWDHDEATGEDMLDGDTRDGDMSIAFNKIAAIEKEGRGAEVTLLSGRKVFLYGSNDVNSGNRGVVINLPDLGKVKVGWGDFKRVEFNWDDELDMMQYKDFAKPKKIKGTVTTSGGKRVSGKIVYDLDETWDLEMLDGSDEDTDYSVPFRNIRQIKPKNYAYTEVTLRSGLRLVLGDSQDVTEKHDGVLVFTSNSGDPTYIVWDDIETIDLD